VLAAAGLDVGTAVDGILTVTPRRRSQQLDPSRITELLARQGLYVSELTPVRADLESVFLDLTADEHLGAGAGRTDPVAPTAARHAIAEDRP
jgi:ABC-2 type transport system ATP-binding protein